jgi:hypothetical protein
MNTTSNTNPMVVSAGSWTSSATGSATTLDRTRTRTRTRIGPVTLVEFAVRDVSAHALLDQKLVTTPYIVNVCRMPHQ